jgi:nitrate reductase NapAB chaperone NapD
VANEIEIPEIKREAAPLAVIVCPTRELCEQVEMQIYRLALHIPGLRIVGLQGASKNVDAQIKAIQKGVDILVSTPGRLVALMKPRDRSAELNKAADTARAEGKSMVVIDEDRIYEEIDVDEEDEDVEEMEEAKRAKTDEDEDDEDDITAKIEAVDMNPDRTKRKEIKRRRKTVEPPTPTRFIIDMGHVRHFILDEVDRMFAMGNFAEIKYAPPSANGHPAELTFVGLSQSCI